MKLESQVISLEYAKKLKEIGVKQNSLFSWINPINTDEYFLYPNEPYFPNDLWREDNKITPEDGYSAFTVAELGEILPSIVLICKNTYGSHWIYTYPGNGIIKNLTDKSNTEADCRAKILIHLIENGLIKI